MAAELRQLAGVMTVKVDWQTGEARVQHRDSLDARVLVRAIESASAGTHHVYRARPATSGEGSSVS